MGGGVDGWRGEWCGGLEELRDEGVESRRWWRAGDEVEGGRVWWR